jgi:hypothetical protein
MQLVMQSVLETFRVDLDNADHAKPDEVLAKHALSKAAGIYYTRLVDRLNLLLRESSEVAAAITADPQADITEGVVDLDDIKRVTENMPNFFGDVTESDLQ